MKLPILILCHNKQELILPQKVIAASPALQDLEICLVDNSSTDGSLERLQHIPEYCPEIGLLRIHKHKQEIAAVRAGARFMFTRSRHSCLGYLQLRERPLHQLLLAIAARKEEILEHQRRSEQQSKRVSTRHQLFAIPQSLLRAVTDKQLI